MATAHGMSHERANAGAAERRKGRMERVIENVASGAGNSVGWLAETGVLFLVFAVMWVAFGIALTWSQGSLDAASQYVRSLPLLVQGIVWLLFLPVMLGLWIWETTWPIILRLILVVGIAGWNLLVLLPRWLQVAKP